MVESVRHGALDIAVTDRFVRLWDDRGSGATLHGAFFDPLITDAMYAQGWRALGSVGHGGNHDDITGTRATILVRGVNAADAMVRPPTDFQLVWRDEKSGAKQDGSVWRPVAPSGYVALGHVFSRSWNKPPAHWYACIRRDFAGRRYVRDGVIGDLIWNDQKSGAKTDVGVWQIRSAPYPSDSEERLILGADLILSVNHYSRPTDTVSVLDLPAAVARRNPPPRPVLTSHREPDPIAQVTDRAVIVPCTLVKDPNKTIAWQVANSPFYTLERRVNYTLQIFRNNEAGTVPQPSNRRVTTGVSKERSEEYSRKTSVTVSASAGISIKAFSASIDTSVTTELGYSSRYGVTQFTEDSKDHGLITPPRSSGALWSATHEVIAIRKDGDAVGGQGGLRFDVDSYVTGEFPGSAGVRATVDGKDIDHVAVPGPAAEVEVNVPDIPHELANA